MSLLKSYEAKNNLLHFSTYFADEILFKMFNYLLFVLLLLLLLSLEPNHCTSFNDKVWTCPVVSNMTSTLYHIPTLIKCDRLLVIFQKHRNTYEKEIQPWDRNAPTFCVFFLRKNLMNSTGLLIIQILEYETCLKFFTVIFTSGRFLWTAITNQISWYPSKYQGERRN